jgi:hypothetical protein
MTKPKRRKTMDWKMTGATAYLDCPSGNIEELLAIYRRKEGFDEAAFWQGYNEAKADAASESWFSWEQGGDN